MEKVKRKIDEVKGLILDDSKRIRIQFIWVYYVLMFISFFMSIVNIFTGKRLLLVSTCVFGVLCLVNILLANLSEKMLKLSSWLFSAELILLLTFFVVSGTPEGFSAIWACLVPASGLLLFRIKRGSLLSGLVFVMLIFFFQTPLGNSFLQYDYTDSFKLRFPMLYLAFFMVSVLLEIIRSLTFGELKKTQCEYEYLYRHDVLTKLYNRYGFNEILDSLHEKEKASSISLFILDLDHFKRINDAYGHPFGDIVLKQVAQLLMDEVGKQASVCRWGGEEFAILFPDGENAETIGCRVLERIENNVFADENQSVCITASIGIAIADAGLQVNPSALIGLADSCLYKAKEQGRNRVIYGRIAAPDSTEKSTGKEPAVQA